MRVYGWAIAVDGKIDVTTVYPTRRGAILNWLVTHGVSPSPMWEDSLVNALWEDRKTDELSVIEVAISPAAISKPRKPRAPRRASADG